MPSRAFITFCKKLSNLKLVTKHLAFLCTLYQPIFMPEFFLFASSRIFVCIVESVIQMNSPYIEYYAAYRVNIYRRCRNTNPTLQKSRNSMMSQTLVIVDQIHYNLPVSIGKIPDADPKSFCQFDETNCTGKVAYCHSVEMSKRVVLSALNMIVLFPRKIIVYSHHFLYFPQSNLSWK